MLRRRLRPAIAVLLAATFSLPPRALARQPSPETLAAYERYRTLTEARMDTDRQAGHFLYVDRFPAERRAELEAQLRRGEFYLEQLRTLDQGKKISVPGGLIHHWIGAAFISGATLAETKAVLEDYEHQKVTYYPDVRESRLISQDGNSKDVFLQFYSKTIVTAVFNVNFASTTTDYSATQTGIRACSTRVADVENFGKPEQRELPLAESRGYLWQLCTWWHIEERSGGTYVEVEAIELSRTVPLVFAWLVNPIIRDVPKTFLSHLLAATRKAVRGKGDQPRLTGTAFVSGFAPITHGVRPAAKAAMRATSLAAAFFGHSLEHLARLETSLFRCCDQQHLCLIAVFLDAIAAQVQIRQGHFGRNVALPYAGPEKVDCSRQIPAPVITT